MEQLFKSADAALAFAFSQSASQYEISAVAKMMKSSNLGSGKGLGGLDGSGQAGMILERVGRLMPIEQAIIVGRFSERFHTCECMRPCCSGNSILTEYKDAILLLDREVAQTSVTGISKRQMRHIIIRAYFERKATGKGRMKSEMNINQYADLFKVARRTAHDHKAKIWAALTDLDKTARTKIDGLLSSMIGEIETEVAA